MRASLSPTQKLNVMQTTDTAANVRLHISTYTGNPGEYEEHTEEIYFPSAQPREENPAEAWIEQDEWNEYALPRSHDWRTIEKVEYIGQGE
jgi:hypothetical protein